MDGSEAIRNELNSNLKEADLRIVPHVYECVISGTESVVVLSNNTDVVTLLFYYMPDFISEGLQELWVRDGAGIHKKFIPVHLIAEKLGNTLCKIVYEAHVLSGCDITSQVGSTTNVLKVNPGKYLMEFGESCTSQDSVASDVENYLVKMIQPKSVEIHVPDEQEDTDCRSTTYISFNPDACPPLQLCRSPRNFSY